MNKRSVAWMKTLVQPFFRRLQDFDNTLVTVLDYVITKWQQQSRKQDSHTIAEDDTSVRSETEMSKLKLFAP